MLFCYFFKANMQSIALLYEWITEFYRGVPLNAKETKAMKF